MPARNIIKQYVENGCYHIYNRGNEKRTIFEEDIDYGVFLKYLKEALLPPPDRKNLSLEVSVNGSVFKGVPRQVKNFSGKIELWSYALMPNHFHLLVRQSESRIIQEFMQSIGIRYASYFNQKYQRTGRLFQNIYRAVLISEDSYLLHLTRYFHRNPRELVENLIDGHTSYAEYLGLRHTPWINPSFILDYFAGEGKPDYIKAQSYKDFVEFDTPENQSTDEDLLGVLCLEDL